MKTLLALLCLSLASFSEAKPDTNKAALELIKSIQSKREKIRSQQSLVKVLQPDQIRQGESFYMFFQGVSEYKGANSIIELNVEGQNIPLHSPAPGLFIYEAPAYSEIKTYNAVVSLSIEDASEAKSIRNAIKVLDIEIADLQSRIDAETDEQVRNELIAQKAEKTAIKNQLVAILASLKSPIGTEMFTFRVTAAPNNNPNFFRISSVAPSFGSVGGGTELSVLGLRFPEGIEATLGGVTALVNRVSETQLFITVPDFTNQGGPGIKHLELRHGSGEPGAPVRNAVRNNAFFAADTLPPDNTNHKPVAVAGNAQNVAVGAEVFLNGSASYDPNPGTNLGYSWKAVSVPAGSGINVGEEYSTNAEFSFMASKPGSYVWELIVSDGLLFSDPSLTVVTANPPENSQPFPSVPHGISVGVGQYAEVQIFHGDADDYQSHTYLITKNTHLGSASVSSTGLVSFSAGENAESEFLEVTVVDNGNPPLQGTVSIPVAVVLPPQENRPPDPSASPIGAQPNGTVTTQVHHGDPDSGQSHTYQITAQSSLGTASISSSGLITFEAGSTEGSDSLEVLVTDSGDPALSGTISIPVTVAESQVTIGTMGHLVRAKDGIIKVGLFASPTQSSNGEIVSMVWNFGDGTIGRSIDTFGDAYIEHDYLTHGTFEVSITATDSLGASATKSHTIFFNDVDLPVVKVTVDTVSGSLPLTVNFDASATTSSETISNYRWFWNDGTPNENTSSAMNSHTFTNPGTYRVRVRAYGQDGNIAQADLDIYAGVTPPSGGSRPWANFRLPAKEVLLNSAHQFDASLSFDPNFGGAISSYNWEFGDWQSCGHLGHGCFGSGMSPTYTYPHVGSFWTNLQVENSGGRFSNFMGREVIVVNSGHAPRAVTNQPMDYAPYQGVAPYTAYFDGSYSFDYDGSITAYNWWFDDPECVENCGANTVSAYYTYNNPGIFWVSLQVEDNDSNIHHSGNTVIVYPNEDQRAKAKKKLSTPVDPDREALKQALSRACFKGKASACFEAGKMYEEDGDSFAAQKFFEKACNLGYQEACSVSRVK